MEQLNVYLLLFFIIVVFSQLFQKTKIPIALVLVIVGMFLSFIPYMPEVTLNPEIVLNLFLPLLIYQISAFSSFKDIRKQWRAIVSLSIGHVLFITLLVAIIIHSLIPQIGWPLAFVLGAIISPPDDVAIVSICEKLHLPERIFLILEGEGMFNDAAALILFRFALAAEITHEFSAIQAIGAFLLMVVGESIYGIVLGNLIGMIRARIQNSTLHLIISFITPFLAYIPAVKLGGTGVLATAMVGFIIGNKYSVLFTSEFRLTSRAIWPTLAYAIESLIFLLVGLDLRAVLSRIAIIPPSVLWFYVVVVIVTVILGRFIWVYGSIAILPKTISIHAKKTSQPSYWRGSFIVSWAGIRGGISLAAALAMPVGTFMFFGIDIRDFLIFIVFCIIIFTLVVQGLTLPFLIRKMGFDKAGKLERYQEHLNELEARMVMIESALEWLYDYKKELADNKQLLDQVKFHIQQYERWQHDYRQRLKKHTDIHIHDEHEEIKDQLFLLEKLIEVEKKQLLTLWQQDKINLRIRNKLLAILDHNLQRFMGG